jgi:hypothetical protein
MQYWFRAKVDDVYKYLMDGKFVTTLDSSIKQVSGFVSDKNLEEFKQQFQGIKYQLMDAEEFWTNYDEIKAQTDF